MAVLCAASYIYGRYDFDCVEYLKYGIVNSYEDQRNCMIEEAVILEDIINDIYEADSTYFHERIEGNPNYNRLIEHYKGKDEWIWEDMYNL